ncbi:MAG: hypothetical protein E6J88_15685 [Deltaproteobacteria bacterium]|nr:MAG: hypothetical protein E6J88_15685 [Deltaproteobacteria bacterium]
MDKLLDELKALMARLQKTDAGLYKDFVNFIERLQKEAEKQYGIKFRPALGWIDPFRPPPGKTKP